jgi:hypothetical protein
MRPAGRALVAVGGGTVLATPAAAHGVDVARAGVEFPLVVAGVVGAGLLGGGLALAAVGRVPLNPFQGVAVPLLVALLGGGALAGAVARTPTAALVGAGVGVGVSRWRGVAHANGGDCADATLGAVGLHRTLEGAGLAALYAANAALGLAGALLVAGHAAAETAAVGALYAPAGRRRAVGAVLAVQAGFAIGAVLGQGVVESAPSGFQVGALALVGSVLLAAGVRETRRRYAATAGTASA